jgi:hypothetical protein
MDTTSAAPPSPAACMYAVARVLCIIAPVTSNARSSSRCASISCRCLIRNVFHLEAGCESRCWGLVVVEVT